jgi:uncharacterized membrane protein YedE/YeeE
MTAVVALIAGLLFGIGLLLSGMTNPANVVAFLDVTGVWRPSLAYTMAGAVVVALPAFTLIRRRGRSLRGRPIRPIDRTRMDSPLLLGSAMFGIGWGLSGICPGPALILLTTGDPRAWVFFAGLVLGMLLPRRLAPTR